MQDAMDTAHEMTRRADRDAARRIANPRPDPLAAAAPALIAALRRAEPAVWFAATSGHPDAVAIYREVLAAIAKAEGVTQ